MHDSSVIRPDDNPGDFSLSRPFFQIKICGLSLLGFDRDSSMTFAYIRCIYTYTEYTDTLIRPLGIFNYSYSLKRVATCGPAGKIRKARNRLEIVEFEGPMGTAKSLRSIS